MLSLRRQRAQISLSLPTWKLILELASVCGWIPQGTRQAQQAGDQPIASLENVRDLVGLELEYLVSETQEVTEADAEQLATALTRATAENDPILTELIAGQIEIPHAFRISPAGFRWFATPNGKAQLNSIIDFCRGGAFQIF